MKSIKIRLSHALNQAELNVKGKDLYMPIRLKLTGIEHGLEMYNIITILGKEKTLKRLK